MTNLELHLVDILVESESTCKIVRKLRVGDPLELEATCPRICYYEGADSCSKCEDKNRAWLLENNISNDLISRKDLLDKLDSMRHFGTSMTSAKEACETNFNMICDCIKSMPSIEV